MTLINLFAWSAELTLLVLFAYAAIHVLHNAWVAWRERRMFRKGLERAGI